MNHAAVILTTLLPLGVMSSLVSVSAVMALEGRRAQTVRRTSGETPGHSAEHVTVTGVGLRPLSATE